MTTEQIPHSFYLHLQQLLDGELPEAEFRELERLLQTSAAARRCYYDFIDIDQGLREIGGHAAPSAATPRPQSWGRQLRSVALGLTVATFAFALSWLAPWVWRGGADQGPVAIQQITVPPVTPHFIATLVRSTDCTWEHHASPMFAGQRLLSSQLHLQRGVAEFRFDTGVRLILEGPARMEITSARSADLEFGKVVLHGHELAAEFALKTPHATLYDVGTEFGVQVDDARAVELHVFEGSVRVQAVDGSIYGELVTAGAARRIEGETLLEAPLRPELFQREVPGRREFNRISRDGLMAYEGFEQNVKDGAPLRWQAGGLGFRDEWRHQIGEALLSKGLRSERQSLEFPRWRRPARDGVLHLTPQRRTACRILEHPIRMDVDAIYYVSFLLQKEAEFAPEVSQYGSVSLRTGDWPADGKRILFGLTSDSLPLLSHNEQNHRTAPPLMVREPYFFVAKIVAGARTPDQILLRIFSRTTPIPEHEPLAWTCMSDPAYDDTVFDHVLLYIEGTEYTFDEIRVGSSWEAVTNFEWPVGHVELPLLPRAAPAASPEPASPPVGQQP